jgi:hypothetical protein
VYRTCQRRIGGTSNTLVAALELRGTSAHELTHLAHIA